MGGTAIAASSTVGLSPADRADRPVGGCLSDRLDPVRVLLASYAAATVLAVLAALQLTLVPVATTAFLGIGLGTGAVVALVARLVPADRIRTVTGVVGAAGGLGGFFPPLVMGSVYGLTGSCFVGFLLLAATAATAAALTATSVRHRPAAPAGGEVP